LLGLAGWSVYAAFELSKNPAPAVNTNFPSVNHGCQLGISIPGRASILRCNENPRDRISSLY